MEAPAPYGLPADCRDLVAPVAAWLAQTGFQLVECLPQVVATGEARVDARWERGGQVFAFVLCATAAEAHCQLWSRRMGMCFNPMRVESLAQVQQLLAQSQWFRLAQGAAHAQVLKEAPTDL